MTISKKTRQKKSPPGEPISGFEEFRIAAEFAPAHIIFTDIDGVIVYANPAAEKITGYSRKEMVGNRPSLWGKRMSKDFYEQMWQTIKIERQPFHGNIENRRKNGDVYQAEMWIAPVVETDEILRGFVGVEIDVSEHLTLLARLEKSEKVFREIAENIEEVCFLYDAATRKPIYNSPGFEKVLGVPLSVFDKNPLTFLDSVLKEDKERMKKFVFRKPSEVGTSETEFRFKRPDGAIRWILVKIFPIRDRAGKLFRIAGVASDITDRKSVQLRLEELNVLKSKFIQVVSHQFRTPLTVIRWNLESMLGGVLGTLNPAQRGLSQLTLSMSKEIILRFGDLLLALEIEEGTFRLQKQQTSVESLVAGVVGEARRLCLTKSLSCEFVLLKESLPSLNIDAERIRFVLERLVDNAVAYTKEGGTVTVRLAQAGSGVRFEVSDTGVGIPAAEQDRIFTRFFRASNASIMRPDASGLGLFLSRSVIEAHGGKIGFQSTEGKGSLFWFELPLKDYYSI